jgi:N-acetylmuramoyl-L-alanine amidase
MTYLPDDRVKWLTIHYSATPIEQDVSAADIDRMHRKRGFREIGYHYYIRKNGMVEKGRDLSQPGRFEVGAHSYSENEATIGVCYEGGVLRATPDRGFDSRTPEQVKAMILLIDALSARFPKAVGLSPQGSDHLVWENSQRLQRDQRTMPVLGKHMRVSARSKGCVEAAGV